MAGYRPKSLDELNDMYDKTISAEKAILSATKQLNNVTETIAPSDSTAEADAEIAIREDAKTVEEFSSEVDSMINRFKEANAGKEVKPLTMAEPTPFIEEPVSEPEEEISFEKEIQALSEIKAEEKAPVPEIQSKPRQIYSLETPDEIRSKAAAKSDERTDLFDEYMKIMNDDDDDPFAFTKKEKKKKHKKGLFFRHEPKEETLDEESEADADLSAENDTVDSFRIEFGEEENPPEEEISSFSDFAPEDEAEPFEEVEYEAEESENCDSDAQNEQNAHPDFDIIGNDAEETLPVPEDIANTTFDEFLNTSEDSEDIYSFDPSKANTIPEYAREQYAEEYEEGLYEEEDEEELPPRPKNKKGVVAGRVILSIFFALILIFDSGIFAVSTVLNVNSGKPAMGDQYIFTANQTYTNSNILEGDLVITEKRYANDGEVFAYINYTQQCFMFGKRNGSIVNDSGDVLFIAENDGERVLVLRDDTRGVVTATYPSIGKIISFCSDNFILITAVSLVIELVIIILLAFVFKDKEKAYEKMMKKMIRKGIISAEEEAELRFSEDSDDENLFSTIE